MRTLQEDSVCLPDTAPNQATLPTPRQAGWELESFLNAFQHPRWRCKLPLDRYQILLQLTLLFHADLGLRVEAPLKQTSSCSGNDRLSPKVKQTKSFP